MTAPRCELKCVQGCRINFHGSGKKKLFYQGLIQASAALYHVLNANPQGCLKLGQEALKKLQNFPAGFLTLKTEDVLEKLEVLVNQAREILGQTRSGFDYKILPHILVGADMDVPT